jgi:hypothetical protein
MSNMSNMSNIKISKQQRRESPMNNEDTLTTLAETAGANCVSLEVMVLVDIAYQLRRIAETMETASAMGWGT